MREHRQRVSSQRVMARARGERERIGCRGAGTKATVASKVVSTRAGKSAPPCAVCSVLLSFRACAGLLWAVLGGETESEYSMIMMLSLDFSAASGKIPIFVVAGHLDGARSARFFQGF